VIGVSTLDILAASVKDSGACIVPVIDARRGLIYCSVYKKKNGRLTRLKPYLLLAPDEFFAKIKSNAVLLGDAVDLYKQEILANIKGAVILDKDYWYPKAHSLIALALEKIREKKFKVSADLEPVYLYPKECQIKVTRTPKA
jgi:tRNA A37 threonylcarbamoyladenosine modification protein TsaB